MKKPAKFSDFDAAVRTREVITQLAKEAIERNRPQHKYATVVSVDRIAMKASVIMETDTLPVTLNISSGSGPWDAGDIVLVDTSLGSMRVEKMVYSPNLPGGVFIRPGLISPVELGINGTGAIQRELLLTPQDTGTDPFYLGRWKLNDSSLYYEGGGYTVGTLLHFLVNVENLSTWDVAANLKFPTGEWIGVAPGAFFDALNGPTFLLEYQIGVDDDAKAFIEFRARYTGTTGYVNYDTFPWSIYLTVGGNATKDPNYPPGMTTGALPTTFANNPGIGDTGVYPTLGTAGWDLTGEGSPAHSIIDGTYRIKDGRVQGSLTLEVGAAISVPGDGNIVNTIFGSVPGWMIPQIAARLGTMGTGPLATGYISPNNGNVVLSAVASGASLGSGVNISVGFYYDL